MSYETWGESYLSLRTELLSEIRKAARHPGTAPSLSFLLLSERLFHSSLYTPVLTVSQSIKKMAASDIQVFNVSSYSTIHINWLSLNSYFTFLVKTVCLNSLESCVSLWSS